MVLYRYVKKKPKRDKKPIINFISYSLLIAGILFLFWSFYPVIAFTVYAQVFINNKILSPIPYTEIASSVKEARTVLGDYSVLSTDLADYTQAGVWFPSKPQEIAVHAKVKEYTLSIPKLNIKDAKVVVGGDNLSKSLIHYIPQSYPGEYGNIAIFGHSTLPQLYNPSNYKTIFTYLPSLIKGDTIYLTVQDMQYAYTVYDIFVVNPSQISVLDQTHDEAYVTLITCVPPGTYWNRLVVKAKLNKL